MNRFIWTISCLSALPLCWVVEASPPKTAGQMRLDSRCRELPEEVSWPLLRRNDGNLLKVTDNQAFVSKDDGQSWSLLGSVFTASEKHEIGEAQLIMTWPDGREWGPILLVFTEKTDAKWEWNDSKKQPGNCHQVVWAIRSDDGGKTWKHLQKIADGYFTSLRSILITPGHFVNVSMQELRDDPGRFVARSFYTDNEGFTWHPSNFIDLGGHGREDGAMDPAIVELRNGRLWMLIRTNLGRFWSAYSDDQGMSWRTIKPSNIEAASAPCFIKRLTSDRLVLLWNRPSLEGKKDYPKTGEPYTNTPASWQREELSIAFSDDDGKTWSKPSVLARRPMQDMTGVAYPAVFEAKPGELWIFTMQGGLRVSIREADFIDGQ